MVPRMIAQKLIIMIRLISKTIYACTISLVLFSCTKDSPIERVSLSNDNLATVLEKMGYTIENGNILADDKVRNTRRLDLSAKNIESTSGLEVFENLEDLNLSNNKIEELDVSSFQKLKVLSLIGNPDLKNLIGFNQGIELLNLPASANAFTGEIRAFLKKKSLGGQAMRAFVEKEAGSSEMVPYNYYVTLDEKSIMNALFDVFGEDVFELIVDKDGTEKVGFDLSHRHDKENLPKELNFKFSGNGVKSYATLLSFINDYLPYLGIQLTALDITTQSLAAELKPLSLIDLSKYNDLKELTLVNLPLTAVNVKGCKSLQKVNIARTLLVHKNLKYANLKELDLSDAEQLTSLSLRNLPLEKLLLSSRSNPLSIRLDSLKLTENNFTNERMNLLTNLEVSLTPLKSIYVPTSVKDIKIHKTAINQLDLSKCANLSDNMIITYNEALATLKIPTLSGAQCKRFDLYGNNISGVLDLSNYKNIRHLRLAEAPSPALYMPLKASERGLTAVKVDASLLIKNALPWEGMASYDNLLQVDADKSLFVNSPSLKELFDKRGEKKIKFYQFGYKGTWWTNLGAVTLFPAAN